MSYKTRMYGTIALVLASLIGIWYLTGKPKSRATIQVSQTASQAESLPSRTFQQTNIKTTTSTMAQIDRRAYDIRNQIALLRNELDRNNAIHTTSVATKDHIKNLSAQIKDLRAQILDGTRNAEDIESNSQSFERQLRQQKNATLISLENQLLEVNMNLGLLNSQLQQFRNIASTQDPLNQPIPDPQINSVSLQITNLESQRSMLSSQIRLAELSWANESLTTIDQAETSRMSLRDERRSLQAQAEQLTSDLNYWIKYDARLGNESERTKKIQLLQKQIAEQENQIQSLQK